MQIIKTGISLQLFDETMSVYHALILLYITRNLAVCFSHKFKFSSPAKVFYVKENPNQSFHPFQTPFDIRMKLSPLSPRQPTIENRNLIREYFTRTRLPPAIFKPSFTPFTPPPQLDIAYTHPARLLADSSNTQPESIYIETNREIEIEYVDDNSIELLDAGCEKSSQRKSSQSKVDSPNRRKEKQIAFESFIVDTPTTDPVNLCKLIGKVSPNLVKTWEQLNDVNVQKPHFVRSISNDSEKILYPEPAEVLNGKQYQVNHVVHSGSSEDFFDSIDGKLNSNLECLVSLCCDNIDDGYAAGEEMAEFESLDRRKICWSIESSRIVSGKN